MSDTLRIDVLMENTVAHTHARTCRSEWGLSLLIHWKEDLILLDAGPTDLFIQNAKNMDIDLTKITAVSLSHHHWDHADGLTDFIPPTQTTLFAHPDLINKVPDELREILSQRYSLNLTDKEALICGELYFLGQIERRTTFEKGTHKDDPMTEDSALALKTDRGCIVISGCSHSGIVNICMQAEQVTGQNLRGVIGGMHLFDDNRETVEETITWFENKNMEFFYPMHCIDFPTLKHMSDRFPVTVFHAGDTIIVDC